MSTLLSSPSMPPIFPITMTDWLPKLGEKAFLAWLRMHSWRQEAGSTDPISLPFSLNRIIKRLKVGNSTFYDQILRPLWNFGLIDLKPAGKKNQLIVFSYPMNDPGKSSDPLLPIRDYDVSSPDVASPSSEIPTPVTLDLHHEEQTDPTPTTEHPKQEEAPEPPSSTVPDALSQLPTHIQKELQSHPKLFKQVDAILDVYLKYKDDPRYTDDFYLRKLKDCIRYAPHHNHFAAYLSKAIQNEWKSTTKPTRFTAQEIQKPSVPPPSDLPEWISRQEIRSKQGIRETPKEISPENQAYAAELLRQLNELG